MIDNLFLMDMVVGGDKTEGGREIDNERQDQFLTPDRDHGGRLDAGSRKLARPRH